MKRFAEILKTPERGCKVLQTSRFGWSGIRAKLSLEGKLRQTLMLSWLVGGQFAAKRGKVMLIGSQKDSKLEHGGALGRPRRPYDRPKVARPTWGMLQLCCGPLSNKGIWGSPKYFSKLGYQYYRQTTEQEGSEDGRTRDLSHH